MRRIRRRAVADELRERALTHGVGVYPMSAWYADPPPETSRLVLGYGALTPPAIAAAP